MAVRTMQNVRPPAIEYDSYGRDEDGGYGTDNSGMHSGNSNGGFGSGIEEGDSDVEIEGVDPNVEPTEVPTHQHQISNVSFGALKQAQDSLSLKRKREPEETADQEDKLEALRKRLRQLKDAKEGTRPSKEDEMPPYHSTAVHKTKRQESSHAGSDDDSDSEPSEEEVSSKARTSKHAPTSMSSKRQVTRKRTVVDMRKSLNRDPRFDAMSQQASSFHPGNNSEKAYDFLRDYQKDEIQELKAAMKKTKSDEDKEILKRKIGSMENRLKAKEAKERQQDVVRRHRKEELAKVQQGKTPFYLKKKDIRERVLVEKFKGMKSKEREKAVEKRKRKEGQKEKKRMPEARRFVG